MVGAKKSDVRGGEPDIACNKLGQRREYCPRSLNKNASINNDNRFAPVVKAIRRFPANSSADFQNIPQEVSFFRSAAGWHLACPELKAALATI